MTTNIRHTGIVVTDMEKALLFYRDLLEIGRVVLDTTVQSDYHTSLTAVKNVRIRVAMLQAKDGNKIELLQYLSHPRSAPNNVESYDIGCSHIAVQVIDILKLHKKLIAAKVKFNAPPQVDPNGYCDDAPPVSCEDDGLVTCPDGSCADSFDECPESLTDCDGTAFTEEYLSWIGDGYCDGTDAAWGLNFACAEWDCDGCDCVGDPGQSDECATECGGESVSPGAEKQLFSSNLESSFISIVYNERLKLLVY